MRSKSTATWEGFFFCSFLSFLFLSFFLVAVSRNDENEGQQCLDRVSFISVGGGVYNWLLIRTLTFF